jgi:cytochrome c-type biogenesis protein CcmE
MKLVRRLATTGIAAVAVLALTAGPASAHFCFKTNLNERAAQGQAGSANWVSFHDVAFEMTGLCDEGIAILAAAGGATPDTLINGHGVMAGGTLRKGADSGTKSISHLDFAAIEAAMPAAIDACRV